MIGLNIKLEDKKSYIGFGNYFSKTLILKDSKQKTLIIVENDKYQSIYEKLFRFFGKFIHKIDNNAKLLDLLLNNNNDFYCIDIDTYNSIKVNINKLKKDSLFIKKNSSFAINELIGVLTKLGYVYNEYFINGSYKKAGDIVYITSFDGSKEYKISFWGDVVEDIWEKQRNDNILSKESVLEEIYIGSNVLIPCKNGDLLYKNDNPVFFTILDLLDFHISYENITTNLNNFCSFDYLGQRSNVIDLEIKDLEIENIEYLKNKLLENKEKIVFTKNKKLIENFASLNNLSGLNIIESNENLAKSFESKRKIVVCDDNISKIFIKKRIKRNLSKDLDLLLKISVSDYIVHIDHGIGIFNGIVTKQLNNIKKEYIEIEYKDNDKLFVPITEVGRVSKYIGEDNPELTGLNTKEWDRKLKKVNEDVERIAEELLETFANRVTNKGFKFERFKEKEKEFQKHFPYIYTEGQIHGIEDILSDMNSTKNMDRLLVGDVGFGKTEIAFNAIFTCIQNKKQACFISPLVVLAYEHYEKAKERFAHFSIKIEILTRLESVKHTNEVLKKLEKGEIDLIIGTHKLLSEKIVFKNLGLIVVDEEHKFGVEDKEKLKKIKIKVDTLSMSATPIPRSLNLALSNIRDISVIKEAPMGRKSIKTIVSKFSENVIFDGCKNELSRGGQIFFIHNKIENIDIIKKMLELLLPGKRIIITHGRLTGDELEDRIIDFKNKKYDILLSTTVIENGIDFANVNTIFINDCDNFGLSQIHQLRGRVGRSDRQGYCYLLYKKDNIDKVAAKRLKTIVDYSFLGAGFEIAMKDLEIRGGGDILGIKQSGQNKYISINIFLELLEKKIYELQNKKENIQLIDTIVDLNIEYYINDSYFNSETDKINFYKEIENIEEENDLDLLIEDFKNVNGKIDKGEQNLFDIIRLRIKANKYKITHIKKVGINYQVEFDKNITVEELKNFLEIDKEVLFSVVNIDKIRISIKNFANDEKFLQYMLSLFGEKILNKKIKLISKKNIGKK